MDPRERFDPNADPDRDTIKTTPSGEPAPDDIRDVGTTQMATGGASPETGTPGEGAPGTDAGGGMPGGGVGRIDEIGGTTGVHRFDEDEAHDDMPVRTAAEWGQGERGPEGYDDAGTSEGSPAGTAQELLED
jgi:hypothetical protein